MSIRPVAAQPYAVVAVPPPAVPVSLPNVPPPVGRPGGPVLTPHTLMRRYESLAQNIAEAAQRPNSEDSQRATLTNLRHLGFLSPSECDERLASLRTHCKLHPDRMHGTENTGIGAANQLWKVVHPARMCWGAAWNRFMMSGSPATYLEMFTYARRHAQKPEVITFYTDDNVQLEGLVIRAGGAPGTKPMMLMVSGNAGCAESEFEVAMAHSRAFDVDVMVYNPRGVGLSLGDTTHPAQALLDCTAAIRKAAEYSERLCVWGCSLGGALTTRALRGLRESHDPAIKKLEFTVCLNSFPSLPTIMGHMVTPRWLPGSWGRGASTGTLSVMGIDPLETCVTLSQHGIGVPGLVCNSKSDEMMNGPSCLAEALLENANDLPKDLQVFEVEAGGHNYYPNYLREPSYMAAIARWRAL